MAASKGMKVPPQSLDSERALLGALLLRPEAVHDAIESVGMESFYGERHRVIFTAMLELAQRGQPLDLVSVSGRLRELGMLEAAGGPGYLAELAEAVPSPSNAQHYAETVQRKYAARNLIRAAEDVLAQAYDESSDLEVLLDRAEKRIFEATNPQRSGANLREMRSIVPGAIEQIQARREQGGGLRGVSTGFKNLDHKLSGLQPSDLIILAARPSMGKTSLALDIARHVGIGMQLPVVIFSLEMSSQQLADRMLAAEAKVDSWKLRTGKHLDDHEEQSLVEAASKLSEAPIFVDERPMLTAISIRSAARRLKAERGLGLIVVDYLQLLAPVNSRGYDSMVQQVTEISRALKGIARELDVPVLALSQLSRKVEDRGGKPRLSDLRDSGSIEQDADVVIFIHREDKYKDDSDRPGIAQIMIEKHRNGPTGVIDLHFDEKHASFVEVDHTYATSIDAF
ncbi:MAG TPA: replicative DNA helicase [Candidatus Paceibacterota bacterium]